MLCTRKKHDKRRCFGKRSIFKSSFTTNPLTGSGTCTVKITDSRNRTANKSVSYSVVSYSNPTINNFTVTRCNQDGTENDEGAYAKCTLKATISSVNNKNNKNFQLIYKKLTDSSYTTINLSNSSYSYESTQIISADINSEYEFIFKVTDYFSTAEKSLNLGTAFTLVDYNSSGRSVAFGRVSTADESEKKMQIKLDTEIEGTLKLNNKTIFDLIYPVGSIYMSVNSTNPKTVFGGTWTQIKDRFLLSAGSKYSSGAEGGESEHTLTASEMPAHSHKVNNTTEKRWSTENGGWANFRCGSSSVTGGDIYTQSTGGGNAHNNMPPYLVVYVWKRTA